MGIENRFRQLNSYITVEYQRVIALIQPLFVSNKGECNGNGCSVAALTES